MVCLSTKETSIPVVSPYSAPIMKISIDQKIHEYARIACKCNLKQNGVHLVVLNLY